jgi:hypothetical protein
MGTTACSAETVLYPTRNLPHTLDGTRAIARNAGHAPCGISTDAQPAMCSIHRADDEPDGTEGYSSVLKGYSRGSRLQDGHACKRNRDHAPCCMEGTRPTSDAQQTLCRRCTEGCSRVLTGTDGYSSVTQGVPLGYSAAGRHACKHTERGPCSLWQQHTRSTIVQTMSRTVLKGTQGVLRGTRLLSGEHATSKAAHATATACMPRGSCIRPPCD